MSALGVIALLGLFHLSVQQIIVPVTDPANHTYTHAVKAFHYILGHWGESFHGIVPCGQTYCEWVLADHIKHLRNNFLYTTQHNLYGQPLTTLSVYNVHTLWERNRDAKPHICELPTNVTLGESEESWVRYSPLLDEASKHFDGMSTTHPVRSDVQRVYTAAFLDEKSFLPLVNFSTLVKGGSYIASDCHRRDTANANRDTVVHEIRTLGFRVDGLGRCMSTPVGPEGIALSRTRDTRYNLQLKREVISKFMFHLAFENSLEDGYVTEKPFDALVSGTVPIYLGDSNHLRALLPHPKAAIFVSDYPTRQDLVQYLTHLMNNETAYEEHRQWRVGFTYDANRRGKPLLEDSWYCRLCQWAARRAENMTSQPALQEQYQHNHLELAGQNYTLHKRHSHCVVQAPAATATTTATPLGSAAEGKLVRFKSSKTIYIVRKGLLHAIPDMNTFTALKLDLSNIEVLANEDMDRYIVGEPEPKVL